MTQAPAQLRFTDEQQNILDAFTAGRRLSIEACAGSGKTTILRTMAQRSGQPGLYLAYNRHVAADARAVFPTTTRVSTANSIAYHAFGVPRRNRNGARLPDAKARKEAWGAIPYADGEIRLSSWQTMHLGLRTVQSFCQSNRDTITDQDVVFPELMTLNADQQVRLAPLIRSIAGQIWSSAQLEDAATPVTHDQIMKMWAMSHPTLEQDFILFDEAQDANPVLADVIAQQTDAQVITVGDSAQQLYGWRGAVDALDSFSGNRLPMTVSFRFGQAIAEEANYWLSRLGDNRRITGMRPKSSVWLDHNSHRTPNAIICRTNARMIEEMLNMQDRGIRVGVVGESKTEGMMKVARVAEDLLERHFTSNADFGQFSSWEQVVEYAEQPECPMELRGQVSIVDSYGSDRIRAALETAAAQEDAEVVVTTCHQAKGREWRHVRLASDFTEMIEANRKEGLPQEEAMVNYVAVTRAKRHLDAMAVADGRA
ncbi:ATP-dependent helicase [Pseudoclavibacter sp. CFCC 13796]|uniref:UvrD-helicase domain-containing protein n=1 Tax=Pseudoclavibacter sp. CFCC 13796 TaxID=2615179 RepID=UPI0013010E66|nr:UvrD-helicase domain-containing protein [Pseudoclavibacter sp. CFCC 13796]KAB1661611.1 ATP-dependent helicase [Pseudoclavibacter sp. CFCC 13796]